ncbi:DUF1828 domain-containing protein [Rodentibacter pneumotropicus]|uniref:DUF1828 domain-containing protein n=1 Tax=Rodentibacter pneumotropicus TaxID=758 RepID=A0A4S2Q3Y9_9PAST|nr:DUF1828 domain-containing protein [Rodentibacter pneumotropicus]THA11302.1 DUF1828 domain-containing protein [Rodentibacter pneumotropicus]
MMNCNWLANHPLFTCREVDTVDGQNGLAIHTSFRWTDGSAFCFYLVPCGNQIMITDDAESIFHLHTQGLPVTKSTINALRDRISFTHFNVCVEEDGELYMLTQESDLAYAISDYLSAFSIIKNYEYQQLGITDEVNNLAQDVENYLRLLKPQSTFSRKPQVKGISGHEYKFDLAVDNQLFLAIQPTPQAVGAAMRKIGDVVSSSDLDNRTIVVVVDDRNSQDLFKQKAEEEIQIISALASAVPFTNLIERAEKITQAAH